MWGYPPWLAIKTVDWEIAEKRKITVFKNDFLNYASAETFLSAYGRYFNPILFKA